MKIIETKGQIADNGSIILPPGVLDTMCVTAGDTVHLAYLSHHPVKQVKGGSADIHEKIGHCPDRYDKAEYP